MIYLIAGGTHTGKTHLAQQLLEKYHFPYLSIDHLKMGLIRSGQTSLTPADDAKLTAYLWPIVREIVKTAIENRQNLIVEGCYIPFTWQEDFSLEYLRDIRFFCLILSEGYIRAHFDAIRDYANTIEQRTDDSALSPTDLIQENAETLAACQKYGLDHLLVTDAYPTECPL